MLAFVALWPAPGYAEGVLVLGALAAIVKLLLARFRGGTRLLSAPAWALTSVLFFAYWLPELLSAFDAIDRAHALARIARRTCATCRSCGWSPPRSPTRRGRRTTFGGLAIIVARLDDGCAAAGA